MNLAFDPLVASMMEEVLRQTVSSAFSIHKCLPVSVGRGRGRPIATVVESMPSARRGFSTRLNSAEPKLGFSQRAYSSNDKSSPKKYFYQRRFSDEEVKRRAMKRPLLLSLCLQLAFLLGPAKERFTGNDRDEIFRSLPSDYCLVQFDGQGEEIEQRLNAVLPDLFDTTPVAFPSHLSLLLLSSAVEQIFEESKSSVSLRRSRDLDEMRPLDQSQLAIVSSPIRITGKGSFVRRVIRCSSFSRSGSDSIEIVGQIRDREDRLDDRGGRGRHLRCCGGSDGLYQNVEYSPRECFASCWTSDQ
jgi:hypothetical protein